jgi:hypothetical protein
MCSIDTRKLRTRLLSLYIAHLRTLLIVASFASACAEPKGGEGRDGQLCLFV